MLNLLLNEAEHNYDVLSVNSGGDTLIHLACKYSTDIQILESLLIKLRTLVGDKEKI